MRQRLKSHSLLLGVRSYGYLPVFAAESDLPAVNCAPWGIKRAERLFHLT